jgi:2-polyprenyl-3-methyl-5-hydroxy-6-metoxy-1,4-benzoquinol methylase
MKLNNDEAEKNNIKFWNEIAPIHLNSYDIEALRKGKSHIDEIQKKELYPVKNKELLHLQCHIGTDTLSLAMDGAKVTGVDFSKKSIEIAKTLRNELNLKADFVYSNIYDIKKKIKKQFDIVYTSKGVLAWLKDIDEWANIISHFLKKDGIFYIMDIHPFKHIFDDTVETELIVSYPYFHQEEAMIWDDDSPDYSDKTYIPVNRTYEWNWSISDIINALIKSGLTLELFNEYDQLFYNGHPGMIKDKKGWWFLEKYKGMIPYTFTLRARKV